MAVRWFAQRQRALLYLGKRDRIPANRSSATAKNNPRLFARFVHKATQRCSESPCVHSRDLCRDSATRIGFTITYKTAGAAAVNPVNTSAFPRTDHRRIALPPNLNARSPCRTDRISDLGERLWVVPRGRVF
jgi:hypothetical protein